jgi:hypothetical protein
MEKQANIIPKSSLAPWCLQSDGTESHVLWKGEVDDVN